MKLTNAIFLQDKDGACPFMKSFSHLMSQDLSISKAMNLLNIGAQLDLRSERYFKLRDRLINKHGTRVEGTENKFEFKGENLAEFQKGIAELTMLEFEITGELIDLDGEQITLKAIDIVILKSLLTEIPAMSIPEEPEIESEATQNAPESVPETTSAEDPT